MWLWLKTKLALAMEAVGINWINPQAVSDGDKLNFAVGMGLGFVALALTGVGVWLALEQRWAAQRELARRAVLKLVLPNPPASSGSGTTKYQLFILNDGDKAGAGFWYLGIPKRMRGRVIVEPRSGNEEVPVAGDNWDIAAEFDQPLVSHFTDNYYLLKFMMIAPVDPGVLMPCGSVLVEWTSVEVRDQAWRIFGWFTNGPGGRFPERGMLKLRMYARWEATFKAQYGGRELPPEDPEEF